jgi:chromosome segregation ATPase
MKDIQFQQLNKQLELIAKTAVDHDKKFEQIDRHFEVIDKRFDFIDKRFDSMDERLDLVATTVLGHENRFDSIDERLEKISDLAFNHGDRIAWLEENVATKKDFKELMISVDNWTKKIADVREDHLFGVEWMKRMQEQLGWHEQDIRKLKLMLNLA